MKATTITEYIEQTTGIKVNETKESDEEIIAFFRDMQPQTIGECAIASTVHDFISPFCGKRHPHHVITSHIGEILHPSPLSDLEENYRILQLYLKEETKPLSFSSRRAIEQLDELMRIHHMSFVEGFIHYWKQVVKNTYTALNR